MEIKCVNLTFQDELVPLEKVNKLIIHHTSGRWMGCISNT